MTNQSAIRSMDGGDWYWAPNDLLKRYGSQLGAYGIAVYSVLAMHAHAKSQAAFPSVERVAELTGMSDRQAQKKLRQLQELGLIAIEPRRHNNGRSSNLYTLLRIPPDDSSEGSPSDVHPSAPDAPDDAPGSPPGEPHSPPGEPGSPKQQSVTKPNRTILTTTTGEPESFSTPGSTELQSVAACVGFSNVFLGLLKRLAITDKSTLEKIAPYYQEDPKGVVALALVLASPEYCRSAKIRSPAGFFLYAVGAHIHPPSLTHPKSTGACEYCGDTGKIHIEGLKTPHGVDIGTCPACGTSYDETDCVFIPF